MEKLRVGIVGATGTVGQRFVRLLEGHPWFNLVCVAASARSAGQKYKEAVRGRWIFESDIPEQTANLVVKDASAIPSIAQEVDFVFCAVEMDKAATKELEEAYAKAEIPVMSNNSAHRWTPDVPLLIPEVNDEHVNVIESQKKRLHTQRGFIAVKPNCSIQSYVPALHALMDFGPKEVTVSTYQAISGAHKTFKDMPEILDNIIPYIDGEEEKSEQEPLKIWGKIQDGIIVSASKPVITAQCLRVPVSDGHMAAVFVNFETKPTQEQIINAWAGYKGKPQKAKLPSAPSQFIKYMEENDRPQTRLDRDYENGMGITVGRLREDILFHHKFVSLSHNTSRGAAGGAILMAELLAYEGCLQRH